ncbi:hypothetical protein QPK87_21560 [Kamptonema cortianum]|uniref:Uncharacterized protein n=1 Tax=Geitlerinema calcuttense NRMC-F 0142 TaxID=2922238 RepID=A0ABT7M0H4_9CYAN|nr:hypothetical protein [Geitlerinema calcuttense]MDI9640714.1 hypothetical protein [Geitlerinema splendidum]MDK3159141.1 hypothetical protein [Kamptonema cortianum]MDL5050005.1 hypothetical protein [Oscillatoria amoena NRMC-F 0135]MDL5057753.1 hypothetical protein [Geitlerinema calcuttense NRMC-F 0142]
MSVQAIPLAAVSKIRQYIQTALALPESEAHPQIRSGFETGEEPPEPESLDQLGDLFNVASPLDKDVPAPNLEGRWFVSSVNPGSALIKLPGLRLKSGFRLVSYLYRKPEQGMGTIWAVPEELSTTAELENVLGQANDGMPPHPRGALSDFMLAIEGDRSAASFAIASLVRREFLEFGRLGKQCNWSHHRLVDAPPPQVKWQWGTSPPKDLSPKVKIFPDGKAIVEFFSCRTSAPVAIFRHVDQYASGKYQAQCVDKPVAVPLRKA